MPSTELIPKPKSIGTQTDLAPVKLGTPFVRFLGNHECVVPDCDTANCFHFGLNKMSVKSPRIPVIIDGIKIPMVIDTGAEVSLLSTEAMNKIFLHGLPNCDKKQVKSLAGDTVTVRGPFKLTIEVCNVLLVHDFFYFDGMEHCLLGYDLVKAAALVIDSESSCVWSNYTIRHRLYPELCPWSTIPPDDFSVTKTSTNTAVDTQILPSSSLPSATIGERLVDSAHDTDIIHATASDSHTCLDMARCIR